MENRTVGKEMTLKFNVNGKEIVKNVKVSSIKNVDSEGKLVTNYSHGVKMSQTFDSEKRCVLEKWDFDKESEDDISYEVNHTYLEDGTEIATRFDKAGNMIKKTEITKTENGKIQKESDGTVTKIENITEEDSVKRIITKEKDGKILRKNEIVRKLISGKYVPVYQKEEKEKEVSETWYEVDDEGNQIRTKCISSHPYEWKHELVKSDDERFNCFSITDENDKLIANYIQEKYTDSDGTKVTVVYDVI